MPRLDRLLTLYYFHPLAKLGVAASPGTPVLMYHSISSAEERVHPYYRINTVPSVFAEQMRLLAAQGYRTIDLEEASGHTPDGKTVVITFDDGYRDFYDEAVPILTRYGFQATVFLATAYVDGQPFNGRPCLSWDQVRELHEAGMSFGSHTHTHPRLVQLSRAEIAQELRRSKHLMEDRLGHAVTLFSYPYRFPEENREFTRTITDELTEAGYRHGVTTVIGRYRVGDNRLLMKRLPINSDDDSALFGAKLTGSYDWLYTPQTLVKRIRARIQ